MSMEAVAASADTSRSTLYRHFTSREHLIAEVTLDAGHRLIALLETNTLGGKTVGEAISAVCHLICTAAQRNTTLLAVCVNNLTSEDPAVIDAQEEIENLISSMFSAVLEGLSPLDRQDVERSIFRYLLGGFILATSGKLAFEALEEDMIRLCEGLLSDEWNRSCTTTG